MPEVISSSTCASANARSACCDPVMARLIEAAGPCTWELRADLPPFRDARARDRPSATQRHGRREHLRALQGPVRAGAVSGTRRDRQDDAMRRCAPPDCPSPRSARCAIWPKRSPTGIVPTTRGTARAGERGHYRAPHAGARHRPLDGGDAADVPARVAPTSCRSTISGCATAFVWPTASRACRARARWRNSARAGRRTARSPSWYLWRASELARAKKLPSAGRAPRVALRLQRAKAAAAKKARRPARRKHSGQENDAQASPALKVVQARSALGGWPPQPCRATDR